MTGTSKRSRRPPVHRGVELRCSSRFEEEARAEGHVVVAGVDEVGRGALCGPVVAGAVVLGDGLRRRRPRRLEAPHRAAARGARGAHPRARARLRPRRRRARGDRPPQHPARHPPGHAAGHRGACPSRPTSCWWTPSPCPASPCRSGRSSRATPSRVSIAAASIVAKVARDAIMRECDGAIPATAWRATWATAARTTARPCAASARRPSTGDPSTGRSAWLF